MFASLIKIQSELAYELPLLKTIEILTHLSDRKESQVVSSDHDLSIHNTMYHSEIGTMGKLLNVDENEEIQIANKNVFVYVFHHTNTIDMRGSVNYFGGSQHSSDLLYLFGPTLFKQISRRRLSQTEEKLCRKLHQLFGDFIKTG